jgi:hypothetical protein
MTRNKGALEKHIFPMFGKRLFASIRPIEWMEYLKRIQLEQKIYEQVKRMCAMCRDIYDYAKVTGRVNDEANSHFRDEYSNRVHFYGMEKEPYFDSHRNLRRLISDIEMNAELNRLIVNAVCNLVKNFDQYS